MLCENHTKSDEYTDVPNDYGFMRQWRCTTCGYRVERQHLSEEGAVRLMWEGHAENVKWLFKDVEPGS